MKVGVVIVNRRGRRLLSVALPSSALAFCRAFVDAEAQSFAVDGAPILAFARVF